jgi:hypothetical protein
LSYVVGRLWYGSENTNHSANNNENYYNTSYKSNSVSSSNYNTQSNNKADNCEDDSGTYVKMDDNKKENLLDRNYQTY